MVRLRDPKLQASNWALCSSHETGKGHAFLEELRLAYSMSWVRKFFALGKPLANAAGIVLDAIHNVAALNEADIFLAAPEQRTIPRQMWSGVREQISPTILAVATILILFAAVLLLTMEMGGTH